MIYDYMKHCEKYFATNNKFEKAFDFLKNMPSDIADGRYEIDGDDVFANVMSYTTKKEEDCVVEGHRKYIDLQYVISGREFVEVTDISELKSSVPYDEEKDCEFFARGDEGELITMEPDRFAIFYPNDLHMGAIMCGDEPAEVKKVVIKISL